MLEINLNANETVFFIIMNVEFTSLGTNDVYMMSPKGYYLSRSR